MKDTVYIQKNIPGNLFLKLSDYRGEKLDKVFAFTNERPGSFVPVDYALTILSDSNLLNMYQKGSFLFTKNQEEFMKIAAEEMLIEPESPAVAIPTKEEILTSLKTQNVKQIEELFTGPFKDLALSVAIENNKELAVRVIEFIEKLTNIAITVED